LGFRCNSHCAVSTSFTESIFPSPERLPGGKVRFTLGTRVRNRNLFGAVYMRLIDRTHRRYVAPAMLSMAVGHLLAVPARLRGTSGAFA
jgi:hypothetical protein